MSRTVNAFDLILLWPMRFELPEGALAVETESQRVCRLLDESGRWQEERDLIRRGANPEKWDGWAFGEFAYFHPYVQRFLYGGEYRLYRLGKAYACCLEVDVPGSGDQAMWKESFVIQQILLYVFDNGTGILTIDLSASHAIPWSSALNAISELRKTYYSNYWPSGDQWHGGGAREQIWITPLQTRPPTIGSETHRNNLKSVLLDRQPRLLEHWRKVLEPLAVGDAQPGGVRIQLLGDNRMAAMASIGTPNPRGLDNDAWNALAQADGAGFATYAPRFRDEELSGAAYDRWWDPLGTNRDVHSRRYLAGPMTFLTVFHAEISGSQESAAKWRRHYYQLFFIAHYQRAALHIMQHRISVISANLPTSENREELSRVLEDVEEVQRQMAVFSSRCWFSEVSPQIQGQELYLLLRRQLKLEALYRELLDEKSLLGNWVETRMSRQREQWRDRVTKFVAALTVAALACGLLGINLLIRPIQELIQSLGWLVLDGLGFDWMVESMGKHHDIRDFVTDIVFLLLLWKPGLWLYRRIGAKLDMRTR